MLLFKFVKLLPKLLVLLLKFSLLLFFQLDSNSSLNLSLFCVLQLPLSLLLIDCGLHFVIRVYRVEVLVVNSSLTIINQIALRSTLIKVLCVF